MDIVKMANGAVATSGNYEIYFDEEKLHHHIMNPKTGVCPRQSSSVTVMASNVMDADALSTTVFVLEPEAGRRFIEGMPGTGCLILDRDTRRVTPQGWPTQTGMSWVVPCERSLAPPFARPRPSTFAISA